MKNCAKWGAKNENSDRDASLKACEAGKAFVGGVKGLLGKGSQEIVTTSRT